MIDTLYFLIVSLFPNVRWQGRLSWVLDGADRFWFGDRRREEE